MTVSRMIYLVSFTILLMLLSSVSMAKNDGNHSPVFNGSSSYQNLWGGYSSHQYDFHGHYTFPHRISGSNHWRGPWTVGFDWNDYYYPHKKRSIVNVGPRPTFLVNDMDKSRLKRRLKRCKNMTMRKTDFSIGHRGAALMFPEHTKESYIAAAETGAGIVECDVTFTKDKELVCRHSQCDLHTTTNILTTELAQKCSEPFVPAVLDEQGNVITPASAKCCTSDITLAEFKTLTGKMDAANSNATAVADYMDATANFRTDLYATRGTLMTHAESIALFKRLKVKMTPELKSPSVDMPFDGFTQEHYAQKMITEYRRARVHPKNVWSV